MPMPDIFNTVGNMTSMGAHIVRYVDHIKPENSIIETLAVDDDKEIADLRKVLAVRLGMGDVDLQGFEIVTIEDVTIKGDIPNEFY